MPTDDKPETEKPPSSKPPSLTATQILARAMAEVGAKHGHQPMIEAGRRMAARE